MFRKMRNRILLLNMVMVSAVVIIAFVVIFVTTYTRVQNENKEKLSLSYLTQAFPAGVSVQQGSYYVAPANLDGDEIMISGTTRPISPNAGLSFSLIVDSAGNIVEKNSFLDLPDEAYTLAAAGATTSDKSRIALEGRTWQYAAAPISVAFTDTLGRTFVVSGEYQNIRFLDITDSLKTLNSLALTLLGLMAVILAVFFFISRFFANRAVRPMEEAWEKQTRFIADASHELKTPLTVINADCGVLYANGEETVASQKNWVDSILRATGRMNGLIVSLLSLARMEDHELEFQCLSLDLSALIEGAADEMEPAAVKKGVRMEKSVEPNITVESDREHIRQLLSILLDNAVKYTDCGGTVTVSLRREKRHIVCEVRNSGDGIPEEDLPRLFDRFYRADPARSSENGGYGLGLSIAKTIAKRLGADLTVESRPDEYTAFFLAFKVKQ